MPKLSECEAKSIMKTILAMKGATTKKHKDARAKGALRLHPRPLTYRGTARNWCSCLEIKEVWTNEGRGITNYCDKQVPSKSVICPVCMETTLTKDMKLKVKSNFSNLKCQSCWSSKSSRKWMCECGCLWYKCSKHFRIMILSKNFTKRICKRKVSARCVDLPFPKFRKETYSDQHELIEQADIFCMETSSGVHACYEIPTPCKGCRPDLRGRCRCDGTEIVKQVASSILPDGV